MNTSKIKTYAIQARRDFIQAVTERANLYGIFSDDHIEPMKFQGDTAIIGEQPFPKKEGELREKLVNRIKKDGFEMAMRAGAYTWFNRFVALRYMEIHGYLDHGYRVLSSVGSSNVPEILENAADVEFNGLDKDKVIELKLAGTMDNELFRMLLLAQCDALHKSMPFLFDKIDSETELLLPDNLLHSDSIIRKLVNDIDESDWQDVEIIGWIYQFYISERKDQVIGKVVKSEDIPAATQLFTPNWIVKYMVQNTLGRMWLATYPDSPLREKMEYYIEPAEQEPEIQKQIDEITPKELNPEEITFLDPACGSGHILIEAYDIFKEIYLERGYRTRDIPRLILEKNLFGLDICDRAGQLACFAVLMKAKEDDRRILGRDFDLNVTSIQESDASDLKNIEIFFKDDDGVKDGLKEIVNQFEDAKTFGSLIYVPENLVGKKDQFEPAFKENIDEMFRSGSVDRFYALLKQADILGKKYDCVVTNPPYMGNSGMNPKLKIFAQKRFPVSKSDSFAMFVERNLDLSLNHGFVGMITMQSWMFLSSYEKFRENILDNKTIISMTHLGTRAFDSIGGEVVSTTSFILTNILYPNYKCSYASLIDGHSEADKKLELTNCIVQSKAGIAGSKLYITSANNFKKIPGIPIAYWLSKNYIDCFSGERMLDHISSEGAVKTGNNERFIRYFWEIKNPDIGIKGVWRRHPKGGPFRKWYGNVENVVDWTENARNHYREDHIARIPVEWIWDLKGITWSSVSSSSLSFRIEFEDEIANNAALFVYPKIPENLILILCCLNACQTTKFLKVISPTLNYLVGDVLSLPFPKGSLDDSIMEEIGEELIKLSKTDWDAFETSMDFRACKLFHPDSYQPTLKVTYSKQRNVWFKMTSKAKRLEEENNRIFIEAYGLQNELTPEVPLSEITLTCNPHYRYGGNKSEEELEALLLTDTMKELVSYTIGCMMGRYSLDEPGIIYAHSGNEGFDPSKYKSFPADDDGIIPVMDQDWFPDDAINRFEEFLKVAWSPETLDENLGFVADSLKPKKNEEPVETIRRYISTGFFKDHMKMYKKRPIYWLFSSGKMKAFECLVYLHRYNESTLSRMRGNYVTPLQGNISARLEFLQNEKNAASTASAQKKFQKEIDILKKKQAELSEFDDELRHYADMKISLDLDDGVKVNYGKFGNLLAEKKAVTGKK